MHTIKGSYVGYFKRITPKKHPGKQEIEDMQGQRGRNERRAGVFLDVAHFLGIAIAYLCSAVIF